MPERIRVGVIGTSWWTDMMHLPSLQSHPRAEVVALCGRNRANADALAQKYGVPQVFTDYRAMIEQAGLDALVIATPDDEHHQMALDALDAGLHVLCEKPLASNAAQAREMQARAQAAGLQTMVFFTYRWMPQNIFAHQQLAEGRIGRCRQASFQFLGNYAGEQKYAWRFDGRRANGVLGDLGSHMIDLARWYLGEIVRVQASLMNFVDRPGANGEPGVPANDAALLLLDFASGAQATIQVSAVVNALNKESWSLRSQLYGETGSLDVDLDVNDSIGWNQVGTPGHQQLAIPSELWGDVDRTSNNDLFCKAPAGPRLFIDALAEGRPVEPNFSDGLRAQEVVDAALESHRSGRAVALSETSGERAGA